MLLLNEFPLKLSIFKLFNLDSLSIPANKIKKKDHKYWCNFKINHLKKSQNCRLNEYAYNCSVLIFNLNQGGESKLIKLNEAPSFSTQPAILLSVKSSDSSCWKGVNKEAFRYQYSPSYVSERSSAISRLVVLLHSTLSH